MLRHIITLFLSSLFATATFFPISTLDTYFIATITKYHWYITLPITILFEIVTAILVYKFSHLLVPLLSKFIKDKNAFKNKVELWGNKISKWGFWGLVIAGASPLPYSFVLYGLGGVHWGNIKIVSLAVFIGRTLKYSAITIALLLGLEFIF